jgi:hypothetical protein
LEEGVLEMATIGAVDFHGARPSAIRGGGLTWTAVAAATWLLLIAGVCIRGWLQPEIHNCYNFYETAGRHWLYGEDLYQELYATCRYAPLVNALFAPVSMLPVQVGGLIWRLVNAAVYLGGVAWWLRVFAWHWTATRRAALWLMIVPLSIHTLNCGQASPLLIGLMLCGVAAAGENRWNAAAGFLAAACLLKVYPVALALLLVVVAPRRFTLRWLAALAVGCVLPFLLQDPAYVARQYLNWWTSLCVDDRTQWATDVGYRDLWMLVRQYRLPASYIGYVGVQLGFAAAAAAGCLALRRARAPLGVALNAALGLGTIWMTMCGPATEGGTYILLAPTAAWAFLEGRRAGWPRWVMATLLVSGAAFMAGVLCCLTPHAGYWMAFGPHPIGALLLFVALLGAYGRRLFAGADRAALPAATA